ncbi:MAG: 3,4-dihydroxy-2-butanone-4-phosphate synthase [Aeropyrum sp.]|nr:3,4-dihydroxy-2-butanone-4-phosphate synthase [Aeropyrum sp.]MCE4616241.1 3,4-dihydroxy-2-butanone-4-phosphate synthase [Aeropyrum sp.]
MAGNIEAAVEALRSGRPVMIFDGDAREGETDLVYYAGSVTWREIGVLRREAGGLICYVTTEKVGRLLGLKFAQEIIAAHEDLRPLAHKTPSYGDPPAFSIWVNHVGVKTGISDEDRALTVRMLHSVVSDAVSGRGREARSRFLREFMAPGHIPILLARELKKRRGHSELAIALASLAGLPPSLVLAEMLGDRYSLPLESAQEFSRRQGIPLVTGDEIVEVCGGGEVCGSG